MVSENVVKNAQAKRFKRLPARAYVVNGSTVSRTDIHTQYTHKRSLIHAERTKEISIRLKCNAHASHCFCPEVKILRQSVVPYVCWAHAAPTR